MKRIASLVSGSAAAVLVAGLAVFNVSTAAAAYDNISADSGVGSVETPSGGVALPGGGGSVAAGGVFRTRISAGPGEQVTLTVTTPGGGAPGISVAASASVSINTNEDGNAFFNVRVPRNTPAGTGTIVGTNAAGAVIFFSEFQVGGRAVHPAAG